MQRARGRGSESTGVRQLQTLGGLANCQSEFKARDKCVFHAVAQVPVATGAQTIGWVVLVRHAEWFDRFGIEPAVRLHIGRLCADTGDFGKGFEQFTLHARHIVVVPVMGNAN